MLFFESHHRLGGVRNLILVLGFEREHEITFPFSAAPWSESLISNAVLFGYVAFLIETKSSADCVDPSSSAVIGRFAWVSNLADDPAGLIFALERHHFCTGA